MNYAVIKTGGKQYRVSEGDVIEVDKLPVKKDDEVNFDQVLLSVLDDKVQVGMPMIPDIKVRARVLEQKKGEKIRVAKFKAKVGYRRVQGFRPLLTKIKIEKISAKKSL